MVESNGCFHVTTIKNNCEKSTKYHLPLQSNIDAKSVIAFWDCDELAEMMMNARPNQTKYMPVKLNSAEFIAQYSWITF